MTHKLFDNALICAAATEFQQMIDRDWRGHGVFIYVTVGQNDPQMFTEPRLNIEVSAGGEHPAVIVILGACSVVATAVIHNGIEIFPYATIDGSGKTLTIKDMCYSGAHLYERSVTIRKV